MADHIVYHTSGKADTKSGRGPVGYTKEGGPALAARTGRETLENHIEKMPSLPFVDVLYIRCDRRHVQHGRERSISIRGTSPWTLPSVKGLRVAFRRRKLKFALG